MLDFDEKTDHPVNTDPASSGFVDREFEYPFLPAFVASITRLLDHLIHPELCGPALNQARVHLIALLGGIALLPIYLILYWMGGGDRWEIALLIGAIMPLAVYQTLQLRFRQNTAQLIHRNLMLFSWHLLLIALLTGGVHSPAVPWFLSNLFQTAIALSGKLAKSAFHNETLVFAILLLTHSSGLPLNLIPVELMETLLILSCYFIILMAAVWIYFLNLQDAIRNKLYPALLKHRASTNNLIWQEAKTTLSFIKLKQSRLRFSLYHLDVSTKNDTEKNAILHQNKSTFGLLCRRLFKQRGSVYDVNDDKILLVTSPLYDTGETNNRLHAQWPRYAIRGCGIECIRATDCTPDDIEQWVEKGDAE